MWHEHDENVLFKHFRACMSGSHHPIGSYRKLETFHLPSLQIYPTSGFENCSTTNFSKARIQQNLWQESINQSPKKAVAWNSTVIEPQNSDWIQSLWEKKKSPAPAFYPTMLGSSVGVRGRQTDSTARQELLSVSPWTSSSVDYGAHRHLFVDCINRVSSAGFPSQRRRDERAERRLSLSFDSNGNWNINLLKGLAADTLHFCQSAFEFVWQGKASGWARVCGCVWYSVKLKIQIDTLFSDNQLKSLFESQFHFYCERLI